MYKTEKKVVRIVLYVMAVALLGFGVYCLKDCFDYIQSLIDAGTLTFKGSEMDIIVYCVDYTAIYFVYGTILLVLARVISYIDGSSKENIKTNDAIFERLESIEDKLDQLLNDNNDVTDVTIDKVEDEVIDQLEIVDIVEEDVEEVESFESSELKAERAEEINEEDIKEKTNEE